MLGKLEWILQAFAVEKEDITDNSKPIVQDMNCNLSGIILREKDLLEAQYKELAEQVLELCQKYNVTCMLHNYPDVAEELHAPNIHLPMEKLRDMPETSKRQYNRIGASCHSVEEAIEAERLGCSYIIAGHIFSTDCKKDVPPRGVDFLKEVCKSVQIPVYAIGGINRDNIALVKEAGAKGACIMSGFMKYERRLFTDKQLLLYAVTDRTWTGKQTLYQQVEQALIGGVTCVQLREKNLDEEAFVKEAKEIKTLCRRYKVPLIINDNLTVAIESGADGIHVGQEDCSVEVIRRKMGRNFIVGATAKTIEQAKKAEEQGADYIGVGAIFPSPTKENAIRITADELRQICNSVSIPAVAIGGITYENMPAVANCGVKGVAVVSAIFSARDIAEETARLKERVQNIVIGGSI